MNVALQVPPLRLLRQEAHTSVSAIKTFLQCPRKYSLHYIERAEPSFRSAALAFGTAFHEAIGEHLRISHHEHVAPIDELHEVFSRVYQEQLAVDDVPVLFDEGESADQQMAMARGMISAFVEQVPMPNRVAGIEVPFRIELHDPETGEVLPSLVGAIDAVVETDDGVEAWELKSSARRWSQDQLDYDPQPTVITMGARRLRFEDATPVLIVTTKTKTPAVQVAPVHRGPEDERDIVAIAASVERAIEVGVNHPVRGWACRGCAYSHACH